MATPARLYMGGIDGRPMTDPDDVKSATTTSRSVGQRRCGPSGGDADDPVLRLLCEVPLIRIDGAYGVHSNYYKENVS